MKLDMEANDLSNTEEWVKLMLENVVESQFSVKKVVQDSDGTRIILDNETIIVDIFFDGIPTFLGVSPESVRMRMWSDVQLKYERKDFFRNWFLYKVNNSELVKWVEDESCGFLNVVRNGLIHYCIVTFDNILDIVTTFEPTINISKYNTKEGPERTDAVSL